MFRCTRCGQMLPREQFRPNLRLSSGVNSWCKPCQVERTRQWRAANNEKYRRRKRQLYKRVIDSDREKTCARCGELFIAPAGTKRWVCTPCQERREADRERQRWQDRPRLPKYLRRRVLIRDNWHCYLCDKPIDPELCWPDEWSGTADHVIPFSVCRHNRLDNLRAAHWRCNREKGDALPGTEIWVSEAA